jgi:tetratricopeptide (TPR) repeat protein
MEICRAELAVSRGKTEEAVSLMESLREKYPDDTMIAYNTAELMWKNSEQDKDYRSRAAEIFKKLKGINDSHYMANMRLTEWYYEQGEYKTAKKCAEKVLASGSDEDFIVLLSKVNVEIERDLEKEFKEQKNWDAAMDLCWCYLQDGKTSKGIMMATTLEDHLPPKRETEWKD